MNEKLFALRHTLTQVTKFNNCNFETISNWLSDMKPDSYDVAIAMLAKSVILTHGNTTELLIGSDDDIIMHLNIISGAISQHEVYVRMYDPVEGYSKMNIFTGEIKKLGFNKTNWTWYN